MYKKAFWFLILITIISLVLNMMGYSFLETIVIVLIIDIIALGGIAEIGRRGSFEEEQTSKIITTKVENIEKTCETILNKAIEKPPLADIESRMDDIEGKVKKQEENTQYLLDRISKKTLELEGKIKNFGYKLAESIEGFDERINKIESSKIKSEIREKPEEEYLPVGEMSNLVEKED